MEEPLRQELLAKTKQALDADDWNAVVRLWQPLIEQGDAEAEYQLAYHYLWCTPCDDEATRDHMKDLLRRAAAKNHPDAIWFLTTRRKHDRATDPEYEQQLLRAGQLGSVSAQRELGVMFATGEWTGPKDLAEAARWYRLAADNGNAESQYDLGFMLLLGEGTSKDTAEGLMWLERAGSQGEFPAFRLLADCYEHGYCEVPIDAAKAQLWRSRVEEYERLNPPKPGRRYSLKESASQSCLECLWDIDGVTGFGFMSGKSQFSVYYEPDLLTPAELDEKVQTAVHTAFPAEDQTPIDRENLGHDIYPTQKSQKAVGP
jgi:TPR repeat protein